MYRPENGMTDGQAIPATNPIYTGQITKISKKTARSCMDFTESLWTDYADHSEHYARIQQRSESPITSIVRRRIKEQVLGEAYEEKHLTRQRRHQSQVENETK